MVQRNNDPGFLTLDVVRRPSGNVNGSVEVIAMSLIESVRSTTELEMTNRPGGLTSTPSRIPGSVNATVRISSDVITVGGVGETDFHSFNRKTQLGFLKGMEGATVTAYARSLPAAGFLGKVRSIAIEDDQSNDQSFTATVSIRQVFQSERQDGETALGGTIRLPALPARDQEDSQESADQTDQPKGTGSHKCLTVFGKKLNRRESIFAGAGLLQGGLTGAAGGIAVAKISQSKWFRSSVSFTKKQFRKTNIIGGIPEALRDALVETGDALNDARKKVIKFGECEN